MGEVFANGKRKALIVMATGTGKARTSILNSLYNAMSKW
ncbi:DEAD/DEAH box helicase family protein [Candidatus Villigracilis affinis]